MAQKVPRDLEMMTITIVDTSTHDDSKSTMKIAHMIADDVRAFLTKILTLVLCHRQTYVMTIVIDILRNGIELAAARLIEPLTQMTGELGMDMVEKIEVGMVTKMNLRNMPRMDSRDAVTEKS